MRCEYEEIKKEKQNVMSAFIDLTGQKFGRLTVIERVQNYISPQNRQEARWLCKCDCGNTDIVRSSSLRSGHIQSCGCLQKEKSSENGRKFKKQNEYIFTEEYVIGKMSNGIEFLIDEQDLEKVQDYCWNLSQGYVASTANNHTIKIHRLIMDCPNNMEVDHINHNPLDNRRANLRIVTRSQNNWNTRVRNDNTSGIKGVNWREVNQSWCARIQVNSKRILLGYFKSFDEAVKARRKAEEKYYGEYNCKE